MAMTEKILSQLARRFGVLLPNLNERQQRRVGRGEPVPGATRRRLHRGFVLRRFERFVSAEARTWWVDGVCRLIGPHPDTPHDDPPVGLDLGDLAPLVAGLRPRLGTVDLACRDDGAWRVIEVGDGQVGDRPSTVGPEHLVAVIAGTGHTGSG